ncbi:MAG TPA: hypothetical protein PK733_09395 [Clostridiales bacterium]|nr:hypothetical protein [Clostridiales bacterium]
MAAIYSYYPKQGKQPLKPETDSFTGTINSSKNNETPYQNIDNRSLNNSSENIENHNTELEYNTGMLKKIIEFKSEDILQGIIYSEILGKPKALRQKKR